MKLILTGATGNVGSSTLRYCIADPNITALVVLSRRPLNIPHPKVTVVVIKNFLEYQESEIEQMKGAQGCVWALGSPTSGKEVHVRYTDVAIEMFLTHLVPQLPEGQRFRFVHTSGALVPLLESNYLFWLGPLRKVRGDLERSVLAVTERHPTQWESYVVRPWVVEDRPLNGVRAAVMQYILKPELGAAMTNAAAYGTEPKLLDNDMLRKRGQEILAKLPNPIPDLSDCIKQ